MNISLTKKQEQYINSQIQSGEYKSASEVVRAALRLHEAYRHHLIEDLRAEIKKGWEGEASSRTAADIVHDKLQLAENNS